MMSFRIALHASKTKGFAGSDAGSSGRRRGVVAQKLKNGLVGWLSQLHLTQRHHPTLNGRSRGTRCAGLVEHSGGGDCLCGTCQMRGLLKYRCFSRTSRRPPCASDSLLTRAFAPVCSPVEKITASRRYTQLRFCCATLVKPTATTPTPVDTPNVSFVA